MSEFLRLVLSPLRHAGFLLLTFLLVGCAQDDRPKIMAPTTLPEGNSPQEGVIDTIPLRWFFADPISDPGLGKNLQQCPHEQPRQTLCKTQGQRCQRETKVYACWPEDKMIRISGRVLDEAGQPLSRVRVTAGFSIKGYRDLSLTYTKEDGSYTLKLNSCLPYIYAQKDSYISGSEEILAYRSSSPSSCIQQDYLGSRGINLRLTRAQRSIPTDRELPSQEGLCRVLGRVMDSESQPIEGALIGSNLHDNWVAMTDKDGVYTFSVKGPCPDYCLAQKVGFSAPGKKSRVAQASCLEGRPADLILTNQ